MAKKDVDIENTSTTVVEEVLQLINKHGTKVRIAALATIMYSGAQDYYSGIEEGVDGAELVRRSSIMAEEARNGIVGKKASKFDNNWHSYALAVRVAVQSRLQRRYHPTLLNCIRMVSSMLLKEPVTKEDAISFVDAYAGTVAAALENQMVSYLSRTPGMADIVRAFLAGEEKEGDQDLTTALTEQMRGIWSQFISELFERNSAALSGTINQ